MIVELVPNEWR